MALTPQEALAAAIRIVGGKTRLAESVGTSRQNVNAWNVVPAKWVPKVIEAIGAARAVKAPTAHDLCPDKFPEPRAAGRGAASPCKTATKPRKKRT